MVSPITHAQPRFGYALLNVHHSRNHYVQFRVKDDSSRQDNDSLYLSCYAADIEDLAKGLGLSENAFKHLDGCDYLTYFYRIGRRSPEIKAAVQQMNADVEARKTPSTDSIKSALELAKTSLGLQYRTLPGWLANAFNYSSWAGGPDHQVHSEFNGPGAWQATNLYTMD